MGVVAPGEKKMTQHILVLVRNHWMHQCYCFGLMMAQWAETCHRIFNFLILITNICCVIFFPGATTPIGGVVFYSPLAGFSLLAYGVSWSHTTTHHSRWDSSGRVISPSQRPLPDITQHSQQTNIHATDGIRTYNLSRRAGVDLRLRPRGHWDRRLVLPKANNRCSFW